MIVPPLSFSFLFFSFLFLSVHSCGYLGLFCVGDHFWGEIWYLLSRVGCDHPCVYFVFSCGYLGLFFLFYFGGVFMYICVLFLLLATILFSVYLFWWSFTFCFAGVVVFSLTMRTLCHLSVGVESHALAFCKKCF